MAEYAGKEIEVKFHINDLDLFIQRLEKLGARLSQPRILEINQRFDTPDNNLSSEGKVLRIRKDSKNWMTFKEPGEIIDGVRIRQEIEFSVGDIKNAHLFLQALGYRVYQTYEKYRSIFILNNTHIMVDELPFGIFIEIESTDLASVKKCADMLDLRWDLFVKPGYLAIYEYLCEIFEIKCGNLCFNDFIGSPDMLGRINIYPADQFTPPNP